MKFKLLWVVILIFGCNNKNNFIEIKNGIQFKMIESGEYLLQDLSIPQQDESILVNSRKVHIGKPFYIAVTEVTISQYNLYMGIKNDIVDGDCPQANIYVDEMEEFIRIVNKELIDFKVRLPTADEWEIAYRYKNNKDQLYWGPLNSNSKKLINNYVWYYANTKKPMPVGKKIPNKLGLYDLNGNVDEVCTKDGNYVTKGGGIGRDSHFPYELSFLPFSYLEIEKDTKDKFMGLRLVLEKIK